MIGPGASLVSMRPAAHPYPAIARDPFACLAADLAGAEGTLLDLSKRLPRGLFQVRVEAVDPQAAHLLLRLGDGRPRPRAMSIREVGAETHSAASSGRDTPSFTLCLFLQGPTPWILHLVGVTMDTSNRWSNRQPE